jgi:hypothetical protein
MVCLSAILPEADQLDDFSNWLRRDQPGGLVSDSWRPTRLRYGEVVWNGNVARLNLRVGDERPFVHRSEDAKLPFLKLPFLRTWENSVWRRRGDW